MPAQALKTNVFETAPTVAPAADAGYVFVEAFGVYVTADGKTFNSEADLHAYLNGAEIRQGVADFMAYVDANKAAFFSTAEKKARTKRDGTVVPAKAGGVMTGNALEASKTRLEKAATIVFTYLASLPRA